MITPIFDTDVLKIVTVFSVSPGSRHRRKELKELTGLNNVPLDRSLATLLAANVLERKGMLFAANHANEDARTMLALARAQYRHLRDIPLRAYFAVLGAVCALSVMKGVEVWLFGSYARLVYRDGSDVDIAVVIPARTGTDVLRRIEARVERSSGVRCEIHEFTRKEFRANRKDPLVREILRNGVRLL